MFKKIKIIGLVFLFVISMQITKTINDYFRNNSKLMNEIKNKKNKYEDIAIDAQIDGNYIVPGLNGNIVNVLESYNNMNSIKVFNEDYLLYNLKMPLVTLENNKKKIIKEGNEEKNAVALIISNNNELIDFSDKNNIKITVLVDINSYKKYSNKFEVINNDYNNYLIIEKFLNNKNINKNICIVNNIDKDYCIKKSKYLVEINNVLYNNNTFQIRDNIKSGEIIYIDDYTSLEDFKLLIRQIFYQDLEIITLSELISETR